jgi:S-formylglutathione hydrolase FrmB
MHGPVKYCAFLPEGYETSGKRYPILYYLHGLGDNEQSLMNIGAWFEIESLRKDHKLGDFILVTPNGGSSFYVNSRDGHVAYGDFFIREFMPYVEHKYRVLATRESRGITGFSMGGFGALRFGFAYPDLFGSISAHSAALVESAALLNQASDAGLPQAKLLTRIFGSPIDKFYWDKNSPFELAKKNRVTLKSTAIFFDCGDADQYGFYDGAKALDQELTKLGVAHQAHIYPGDHSVQYLLQHLEESLEFHARIFAAHSAQR